MSFEKISLTLLINKAIYVVRIKGCMRGAVRQKLHASLDGQGLCDKDNEKEKFRAFSVNIFINYIQKI